MMCQPFSIPFRGSDEFVCGGRRVPMIGQLVFGVPVCYRGILQGARTYGHLEIAER